jgi:predicted  nucleic acid-binding Zn-ribbon protein
MENKFCMECGTAFNSSDAAFCMECGAPIQTIVKRTRRTTADVGATTEANTAEPLAPKIRRLGIPPLPPPANRARPKVISRTLLSVTPPQDDDVANLPSNRQLAKGLPQDWEPLPPGGNHVKRAI